MHIELNMGKPMLITTIYTASGDSYSTLIENNYFKKVANLIEFMYNIYTFILQRNNVFDGYNGKQGGLKTVTYMEKDILLLIFIF